MRSVRAVRAGHEVSRLSYFALYALQHRGQESAGIAAADRGGHIITRRELGLVNQVFTENDLRTLAGELAIGHVRYSTTGSNAWENSQPVQRSEGTNGSRREVALAHNGNLINAVELHDELSRARRHVQLDVRLRDHRGADRDPSGRAGRGCDRRRAPAPARRVLDRRDDEGPRRRFPRPARPAPAVDRHGRAGAGEDGDSSATPSPASRARSTSSAPKLLRDVEPGEMVTLGEDGLQSQDGLARRQRAFCVFEYIYFARPDSRMNVACCRSRAGAWARSCGARRRSRPTS